MKLADKKLQNDLFPEVPPPGERTEELKIPALTSVSDITSEQLEGILQNALKARPAILGISFELGQCYDLAEVPDVRFPNANRFTELTKKEISKLLVKILTEVPGCVKVTLAIEKRPDNSTLPTLRVFTSASEEIFGEPRVIIKYLSQS